MIDASGLAMQFGPVTALKEATFRVEHGEILGLLGPNGAGKSTIMKILTTFLHPTGGTASVCGHDVLKEPLRVRQKIGYLPENLPLYLNMETGEYLEFVGQARGLHGKRLRERMEWVLTRTGLTPMFHRLIGELSKGYRQRTALAQALIHDPEVIILDEPTTGLDPHQILEIRGLIRELASTKTVLFSTHILQEVEAVADRVVIISQGEIKAQGTLDELAARAMTRAWGEAQIKGEAAAVERAVCSLDGMEACSLEALGNDWVHVRFTGLDPAAQLERIGTLCLEQGWILRELTLPHQSLESVFLALTSTDHAA